MLVEAYHLGFELNKSFFKDELQCVAWTWTSNNNPDLKVYFFCDYHLSYCFGNIGRMHFILFNWATNKYQWFCQVNISYKRWWQDNTVSFSVDLADVHAVNNLPVPQTRKILLIGSLMSGRRRIAKIYVWIILIVRSIPGQIIEY